MRRFYVLFLALALLIFNQACKRDSDVLATYSDGQITRGEFHSWMDTRHIPRESVLSARVKQKAKLRQMMVERLTVSEAKKAGFEKNDDFMKLQNLMKSNFISGYLQKQIRESGTFDVEAVKASIIKLRIKDYNIVNNKQVKLSAAELKAETDRVLKDADGIIARLDAGEDFAGLAKNHSDDYSKRKGGDIGFVTREMREPEFTEAAFALGRGEYTKKPVLAKNAVYIIRVARKDRLTPDNIAGLIDDENEAKRLKSRLQADAANSFEKSLGEAADVVNNIEKVNLKDGNALIYKVGAGEYRVSALNDLISFIEKKRGSMGGPRQTLDEMRKRKLAERMFHEALLVREAQKKNLDREEKFQKEWNSFYEFSLASSYRDDVILAGVKVTPDEVRKEYDSQAQRIREQNTRSNQKNPQKMQSFGEMKDRIEYMLVSRKRAEKGREYENQMVSRVNLVINEKKLEEDKKVEKKK
jgi:peptidyl-prolyl cis-trans isomerase C